MAIFFVEHDESDDDDSDKEAYDGLEEEMEGTENEESRPDKIVDHSSALKFLGLEILLTVEDDLPAKHRAKLKEVISKHLSDARIASLNKRLRSPGLSGITLPHQKMFYQNPGQLTVVH